MSPITHTGNAKAGVTVNHDLRGAAFGKATLIYKGRYCPPDMNQVEIECEIYKAGDLFSVHTVCPKCRHTSWIDGKNKNVSFDSRDNSLHVESFECAWEMGGENDKTSFGIGLCRLTLAYDGKIARDA